MSSRTGRSSSTISTVSISRRGLRSAVAVSSLLEADPAGWRLGNEEEHDPEGRPQVRRAAKVDGPAMILNDLVRDGQPQPRPALLGREEGREHVLGVGGWAAGSRVGDLDTCLPAI